MQQVVATDIEPSKELKVRDQHALSHTQTFSGFWSLGHGLFRSTDTTFAAPFLPGDLFDASHLAVSSPAHSSPDTPCPPLRDLTSLNPLRHHVTVIHASALFHLFSIDQQLVLARALAGLLSPTPGSCILGWNTGSDEAGFVEFEDGVSHPKQYCHSPESWTEMWNGVVFQRGAVTVQARNVEFEESVGLKLKGGAVLKKMEWIVTRVL